MVLTNYECRANIEEFTNSCDITTQQTLLKSQAVQFNPSVLNTCGIAQPESCFTQRSESNEISAKTVSQISSNGYYGFNYLHNNVDNGAANIGNCVVDTHYGKHETKRHHILDASSSVKQPKRRVCTDGNCTNKLEIRNSKRCRLETDKLPVLEPPSNMDVDVAELDKDANNMYGTVNIHQTIPQSSCLPNKPKNNFEKIASYGLMPGQAQITARVSDLLCNTNPEAYCSLYRSDSKRPRINGSKETIQEIPCYDKNKRHLEKMFSETHGSGLFYLGLD